ncbi:hypothetical protein LCGC14_2375860 [marine sediment metagenome]|uniref:Uncharacterized protein n=1 Tax=marine sediment metagenome TaxID=412755 RepID=A0A0F9C2F1_9ZZZZ
MAIETKDAERLAGEGRSIATLAAALSNCVALGYKMQASDLLRSLDAALADARHLTQDIIKSAKE